DIATRRNRNRIDEGVMGIVVEDHVTRARLECGGLARVTTGDTGTRTILADVSVRAGDGDVALGAAQVDALEHQRAALNEVDIIVAAGNQRDTAEAVTALIDG